MKIDIKIPAMGESISEATIGTIFKQSGSPVAADEELLELETDKVNQVLYAPQAGVVQITVSGGEVVKIGQVIGSIETEGAVAEAVAAPPPPQAPAPTPSKSVEPAPKTPAAQKGKVEVPKSAKEILEEARQTREAFLAELAAEEAPTGPAGYAQPTVALTPPDQLAPHPESRKKMSKIRRVIAGRMLEAQSSTAMLTSFNEVDMTEVIGLRTKYQETFQKEHGVKLGFMSFFVKACVSALKAFPEVNASIDGEDIVYKYYYDIGIAVGTDRGVIVPIVRNSEKKSFAEIESQLEKFAQKAREGTIGVDDLQGGTFTITNGGVYGSLLSTPILVPPQSGILGMHKIVKRAVVIEDKIEIRPMMYIALTYDHRLIDGREAVSFLVHVKNMLEDPSRLLLQV